MKLYQLIIILVLCVAALAMIIIDGSNNLVKTKEKDAEISEIANFATEITNDNNKLKAEIKSMKPLYYATQNLITNGRSCYISVCTGDIETYNGKEGMVIGFNGDNDVIIQKDGTISEIPRNEARQKRS